MANKQDNDAIRRQVSCSHVATTDQSLTTADQLPIPVVVFTSLIKILQN